MKVSAKSWENIESVFEFVAEQLKNKHENSIDIANTQIKGKKQSGCC